MSNSIRSMTGFGSAEATHAATRARIEVRSVNHRYLKVSTHVSDGPGQSQNRSLGQVQYRLEELLRDRFARGSYQLSAKIEVTRGDAGALIDQERAVALHQELVELSRATVGDPDLPTWNALDLARLDGVIRGAHDAEVVVEDALAAAESALDGALTALETMQEREGAHLVAELTGILDSVETRLDAIEKQLPSLAADNRERYRARLNEFISGTGVELDDATILREVAVLAEKADITEEIGRLRGHFDQYRDALSAGGRVGRKLDFLTQEMFREANTMTSKVNRFEVAAEVVEVKAEIDRLREQSHNIE